MFTTNTTPAACYCRGAAVCEQGHHVCTNCTCDIDGTPQETAAGYINPTTAKETAWAQKQEANR
jgi:hypothetical protein